MKTSRQIWLGLVVLVVVTSCPSSSGNTPEDSGGNGAETTPIYLTVAGHIEDVQAWASCDHVYPENREELLAFAERFAATGAKLNLQIDHPFLVGASNCETEQMRDEYAGTDADNVVDYLAQYYGFEIDAHRGGGYEDPAEPNYADIRQLAGEITSHVSEVVGGFIWIDSDQFERLHTGETGNLPDTTLTWQPQILSMATGWEHHLGDFSNDDRTSGVWIPAGADTDFYTHDSDNHMVYVGPGQQHANWNADRCEHDFATPADYTSVLLDYIERGLAPAGRLYTLSIGVPQSVMFGDTNGQDILFNALEELQPLVTEGKVVFATYSEVVDIWRTDYDSEPNIFRFDQIDPGDYTCPQ